MRLLGAVLAGGQSRRFGSDKAVALLDGVPLIERAIAGLRPQVAALIVCGRPYETPLGIADRPAGQLGPLAGLNAALHYAADDGFDAVVSLPCDVPVVPTTLVRSLQACAPTSYVASQPVIGLWPVGLAARLDDYLQSTDDRSARGWIAACGAAACELGTVANINTAQELSALA